MKPLFKQTKHDSIVKKCSTILLIIDKWRYKTNQHVIYITSAEYKVTDIKLI